MKRKSGSRFATVMAALLCCASLAFAGARAESAKIARAESAKIARAESAKIEGVALDTAGAGIAQAAVTLKPPSGAEKRAVTDAKGAFTFGSLPSGAYSVMIDAPGFQKTRYTNIVLTDAQTRQFDFTLVSGAVSETVEIDITRPKPPTPNRESRPAFGTAADLRGDEFLLRPADQFIFRPADEFLLPPVVTRLSGIFRLSGRLINEVVARPLNGRQQWGGSQPIAWRQLRVTLEPAAIAILGANGVFGVQRAPSACLPPARASFASAVSSEGRFDFGLQAGVYDLCVFANGGAAPGGGASSGGAAWRALAGPFSIAVDRDIDSLLVDLGAR